jgi:large subunit ribosomal protein L6
MSRVGKNPISLPNKVEISVSNDNMVTVKGPKGQLTQEVHPDIKVELQDGTVVVSRPTNQQRHRAMHGLYRSLINNMIIGVSEGYTKELEMIGVGYRCNNTGQLLELLLGYSHPIQFMLPPEVKVEALMEKGKNPTIKLQSIDKQLIGQVAAKIRSLRGPEPYKGKGVRFVGEQVRRKAGKTTGKK